MSPHLPVLSSHRERQASDFILDMETAKICGTVIDVVYSAFSQCGNQFSGVLNAQKCI